MAINWNAYLPLLLAGEGILNLFLFVGVWFIWKRQKNQITRLQKEQGLAETTLRKFMEESEKTFLELCRLMQQRRVDESDAEAKNRKNGIESPNAENLLGSESCLPSRSKILTVITPDRKKQVLTLSGSGLSALEIARRMNIPRGEIDLILNLNKTTFRHEAIN
jgi:hypothetical protein